MAEITPEEKRRRILDWLLKGGLLMKSKEFDAIPSNGFPVKVCEECGCIVDAELWQRHQETHG